MVVVVVVGSGENSFRVGVFRRFMCSVFAREVRTTVRAHKSPWQQSLPYHGDISILGLGERRQRAGKGPCPWLLSPWVDRWLPWRCHGESFLTSARPTVP